MMNPETSRFLDAVLTAPQLLILVVVKKKIQNRNNSITFEDVLQYFYDFYHVCFIYEKNVIFFKREPMHQF